MIWVPSHVTGPNERGWEGVMEVVGFTLTY